MKQSTVNIMVILGVVIMALGAWTMPMYTAGLNRAAFDTLGSQLTDTQNSISGVKSDISGGGLQGGLDLASLQATTGDQDALQKALGSNFNSFSSKFIKKDSSASQFQTIEVKTFDPARPRFKIPNDLVGSAVNEAVGNPSNTTCNANGTTFPVLSSTTPTSIYGFALLPPAGNVAEIQICTSPQGTIIVDELIQPSVANKVFTKNFAYGVIPPNQALKVLIHDTADAQATYQLWIFGENPVTQPIRIVNDFGGGLAGLGTQCTSITVTVNDGSAGSGVAINGARVQLKHTFLPLIGNKFSASGQVVFNAADFGGVMPPGLYFVEVTPPPAAATALPFRTQVQCPVSPDPNEDSDSNPATRLVAARLATATQFSAAVGGGNTAGALTVNIKDQSGAPIINAFSRINAQFAPIVIKVCDGIGAVCTNPETGLLEDDSVPVGTLIDPAADGTFQLTNLPLPGSTGAYSVGACKVVSGAPRCTFQSVTLTTAPTTLNLSISIPIT